MKEFKSINYLEFIERFSSESDCYQYLVDLKWDKGYKCRRCGNSGWVKGKKWYYRRCKSCSYDESATSGTLFHKIKFPILKAFHILFRISTKKKGMSTVELANEFGLQQKTCWLFKAKIQEAMKSSGKYKLSGIVHVDEFAIGMPEKDKPGRSNGKKVKIILGVEIIKEDKVGRVYAKVIKDNSASSFRPFFEQNIEKSAQIETDAFPSYSSLKNDFNITQYYSEKGKAFPELHIQIMNFKKWLIGIHHKCSSNYFQKYLNEYFFRFNRRVFVNSIFHKLVERLITGEPITLKGIRELNT
ncbi:MAG: IS1595 family transposase [Sporocytophaga sp.]|nr:IS1595 family transposase [Sporocytophaga sp.]